MLFSDKLHSDCPIRQKIRAFHHVEEEHVIDLILPVAEVSLRARSRAWERARQMVLQIREEAQGHGGVDALLNEYSLSSAEGVVLMCLAEALLRIPDKHTQDELIRDKLSQGQWSSHLGNSDSLFVNASSWGLLLTGNMVNYADKRQAQQMNLLKKTLGRLGEPVIRKSMNIAMKVMGRQFVMGETIEDAVKRARDKEQQGYVYSYDMLGEGARTQVDADRYFLAYEQTIEVIGQAAAQQGPRKSPGISVKLSAIHPRYELTHRQRILAEMPAKLKSLCLRAKAHNIGLTVDAEESERLDLSLDIIEHVFSDPDLDGWDGFGLAVQAYQKRALFVIDWLKQLTDKVGRKMMVRLVKGAYWDTEIKKAQKDGIDHFPVFTRKSSTDVSYQACANRLLDYRDSIYPQFATHNAYSASVILELAGDDKTGFEFQCLHGMGDTLYDQIVTQEGIQCRIYAPVGQHEDLLAYLVRRLLENGANSSFVNAIIDEDKSVESLLEDPVERTQRLKQKANPQIIPASNMFGQQRANSTGLDIHNIDDIYLLKQQLEQWQQRYQVSQSHDNQVPVFNPANQAELVGYLDFDSADSMLDKLQRADQAFAGWANTPVSERAELANRIANALERHRHELIALCIKEAGKITQDGIDEVREAVDFCRYYADQAIKLDADERLQARGVVLCISPWNFPLAIFLGQVVAAMVTGNTVLAKPAEQTSLIAQRALQLMHAVGLPEHVVQLVISQGAPVGDTLLPDERIKAVMFTGSTQTAALISRTLAARNDEQIPLIAETGGQNCMVVDSTALPEQVVDDVIQSGFQSAGQRCSALRVLYLQEEVADGIIQMLIGAMQELTVGDPAWLSTDIGPVIDQKALSNLTAHADYMQQRATLLYQHPMSEVNQAGTFFAPRLYEVNSIDVLKREVFGPCVHVIRFAGKDFDKIVEQVNSSGYGLTMGIHTRIEERSAEFAKLSRAGNLYINRNMIGAIVGVQPFGGRGLSGTGPKAGGPNYLPRLMQEKATPDNEQIVESDFVHTAATDKTATNQQAAQIMQGALAQEQDWRLTDLNERVSKVRQLLAKITDADIAEELTTDLDGFLAQARAQLIAIEKCLSQPTHLPGPTGESNILYLEPRGVLICYADKDVSFEYWAMSIVTALAAGNVVISIVSDGFNQESLAFRQKFIQTGAAEQILQVAKREHLPALLSAQGLAGVVMHSHSTGTKQITKLLAQREGPILPLITAEYDDNLIQRLLLEKTISIDTTASGGNTSLMTLVETDE